MKIYIVAFAPSKDSPNGVGGFDWYVHRAEAVEGLISHLPDEGYDYHFMEVPGAPENMAQVTEWVEKNVELP